ncbi:MAG: hypothetical protein KDB82_07345 [Planctomycetes bacterium]|nr:hypothetical protein [Planctomycetota bacterium]
MTRLLPLLLVLSGLLLAACSDGNTPAGNGDDKYIPDVSTADGAIDVYSRAIATRNLSLAEMIVLDDEREAVLADFRKNFAQAEKQGITFKLKFLDAQKNEDQFASKVIYNRLKNGEPDGEPEQSWIVFIKTDDGRWKYSRARSRELAARMMNGGNPPGNETPAGNEEPASND